jgi:hypothetical protein
VTYLRPALFAFIAAALLAAVGWFVADSAFDSDTAEAQPPLPSDFPLPTDIPFEGLPIVQCFNVTDGDDPNERIDIFSLNYDVDDVTVRRATQYCEIAFKNGEGAEIPAAYLCHTITGGQDPNWDVFMLTENFGEDEATVRAATTLCRPAVKQLCDGPYNCYGSEFGILELPYFYCLNLTGGNDPNRRVELLTPNFGEDEVTVRRSTRICDLAFPAEFAEEIPSELAYILQFFGGQCFTLTGGQDPNRWINLGMTDLADPIEGDLEWDTVRVRASTVMCEFAFRVDEGDTCICATKQEPDYAYEGWAKKTRA